MEPPISFLTEHQVEVLYHFSYQFLVFYPLPITHHCLSSSSFRRTPDRGPGQAPESNVMVVLCFDSVVSSQFALPLQPFNYLTASSLLVFLRDLRALCG